MKTITRISTFALLLLFSNIIYGQKIAIDSAIVQIENKAEINLAIYNYKNLAENVEADFKSLQEILKETKDIPEKISYSIHFEPNKSMTIKQIEAGEKLIWENGVQTIYQFNNQCNITNDNYYLKIQFNELEVLMSDSLITQLMEVIDTTNVIQGRYSATYSYTFEGMQLNHTNQYDKMSGLTDALMLSGGVGVNLIKSEPIIDISAEMGLALRKKRTLQNQYYVSYNLFFDFAEESTVNLNGFLNIGYKYNLSNKINKPNWLGVEIGYLVNRQGELFGKNTFKLGINWELGKFISVAPQLYMSGDFNQFYPAVRIGFGF
jgi:hypothetical protein